MAPTQKPKPGDLIEIYRGLYQHWAIYIGDGFVIHLASEGSLLGCCSAVSVPNDIAIVKMEKLHDVVGNDEYRINNLLDYKYKHPPISYIIKEAKGLVGMTVSYCLFTNNCEHFVTNLRYGKPECRQLIKAGFLLGVFGVVIATISYVALTLLRLLRK